MSCCWLDLANAKALIAIFYHLAQAPHGCRNRQERINPVPALSQALRDGNNKRHMLPVGKIINNAT